MVACAARKRPGHVQWQRIDDRDFKVCSQLSIRNRIKAASNRLHQPNKWQNIGRFVAVSPASRTCLAKNRTHYFITARPLWTDTFCRTEIRVVPPQPFPCRVNQTSCLWMSVVLERTQRRLAEEEKRLLAEQTECEETVREQEILMKRIHARLQNCRREAKELNSLLGKMHQEQETVLMEAKENIYVVHLRRLICQYAETPPFCLVSGVRTVQDPAGLPRQVHFYETSLPIGEAAGVTWTIEVKKTTDEHKLPYPGGANYNYHDRWNIDHANHYWGCFTCETPDGKLDRHINSSLALAQFWFADSDRCLFNGRTYDDGSFWFGYGQFFRDWEKSGRPSILNYKFAVESIKPREVSLTLC